MARQAWQRTITDAAGNVLTGVQITVFQENGVTLATIYGQQTGGAALANPFSTGAQTSAKFYADPGRYVVRAFKDGLTQEFTDVDIGGKAVREDLGSAAYLTATVNAADHVAGRSTRVGDFGNGAMLDMRGGSAVPFTNYDQPQKCWGKGTIRGFCDGASLGIPGLTSASYGVLEIHGQYTDASGNSGVQQRFYFAGVTFFRQQNTATTWGAWNVVGAPVLGTVSFVSGFSTGAVLEYGTNSNGSFLKLADGTVFAWGRVIQTGITLNPAKSTNSNTAYVCAPVAPTTMMDITLSIGQRAIYDATNDLIYSTMAASTNGNHIILNLGMKPSGFWPNLDALGTVVATKVDYYWTAVGRWR